MISRFSGLSNSECAVANADAEIDTGVGQGLAASTIKLPESPETLTLVRSFLRWRRRVARETIGVGVVGGVHRRKWGTRMAVSVTLESAVGHAFAETAPNTAASTYRQ